MKSTFFPGCLCGIRISENGTARLFSMYEFELYVIADELLKIYRENDKITLEDILIVSCAKSTSKELEKEFKKIVLSDNIEDHILIELIPGNEDYARYVLTIDGFYKES